MDRSLFASPFEMDAQQTADGAEVPNAQPQTFFPEYPSYYTERVVDSNNRPQQRLSVYSTATSPGESSLNGSRKRTRDEWNDASLATTPGAWPATPTSMDYSNQFTLPTAQPAKNEMAREYIDLTGDEPLLAVQNFVDPFAQLENAYQPGYYTQTPQTFNQDWMNTDDLAQFLQTSMTPNFDPGPMPPAMNSPMAPNLSLVPFPPAMNSPVAQNFYLAPLPTPTFANTAFPPAQGPRRADLPFGGAADESADGGVAEPAAVQNLIENIRLNGDVEPEAREQTPSTMKSTLMEHQKIALTWLLKMERGRCKGGILADEMGLGKTVEALSLILANPSNKPACKTTLIIAPVALIRQWEKEIERHVKPEHRLSVYVLHGFSKKADFDKLRTYDVVLTTYGTLAHELKTKEERIDDSEEQERPSKRSARERLALLGPDSKWYRVILDEAQCIKNKATLTSKAANELRAVHRLCMTGTPMMNSVDELYSLVRFLKIPPYDSWHKFSMEISKPIKSNQEGQQRRAMSRVQALLKSVMLRRGKTTKVDGKEICQIPPKHAHQQHVEFSEEEMALYKAIETNSQLKLNHYLKQGTVNNNYANVLVMLLRLRQLCCHPFLIKDLGIQVSTQCFDERTLIDRAKMLDHDAVDRLKQTDSFECPICYETDPNPTVFTRCGHTTCGDCFQRLIDPSRAVRDDQENSGAKCPQCRDELSTERITDFEHFCKVHDPERLRKMFQDKHMLTDGVFGNSSDSEFDVTPKEFDFDSDSDFDTGSESELDDEDETLGGFIVDDDVDDDLDDDAGLPESAEEAGPSSPKDGQSRKDKKKNRGKGKAKAKSKAVTLAQLKKESLRSAAAKRKYLKRLRKDWKTSTKVEKTLELLSEIHAGDLTTKILIFSQFTALLDLLEVPLSDRKIKYQRYDGSMRMNDRAEAVNQFMDTPDQNVMLVSLKAGNAGLNLSKASHVIILDPFWNPFVEDQAVDRAHRMPQKREVHVHRILVPATVEDRICALQQKKRDIINTALDDKVGKSLSRLSTNELRYLFGI